MNDQYSEVWRNWASPLQMNSVSIPEYKIEDCTVVNYNPMVKVGSPMCSDLEMHVNKDMQKYGYSPYVKADIALYWKEVHGI